MRQFEFKDDEGAAAWARCVEVNSDPYGKGTVDFARRWAQLMEDRIANGETVISCADKASHDADTEGISGFMYGCAVSILSQCWKHGEDLRRWHNKEWGAEAANDTPGACINPAIVTIGGSE